MQKTMDLFQPWKGPKYILLYSFIKLHDNDCYNGIIELNSHQRLKFITTEIKKIYVLLLRIHAFLLG